MILAVKLKNAIKKEAEHDYRGYHNRWADTFEELVKDVCKCLTMTPEETRDTRI